MTETLWDPEPEETQSGYPLPVSIAEPFGIHVDPTAYGAWVKHGGDPRFYPFTGDEYAKLEHWWIAEMSTLPTADLESELEYVTGRLVSLQLTPDVAEGLIDGVQYRPILEQRASWLTWETRRRAALPEPPRAGARIPSDFVRRIKDACSLPEFLVGELGFTGLKRQGRDYIGLCPFHTEKTGSFMVHADRFHCFGCGQSGDVFDILLVSSTCRTWRAAVEYVARYVGIAMPQVPTRATPQGGVPPQPIWSRYSA